MTLVGAGPGDPGLLTLAGLRALAEAEVVLYDRLASDAVLALAPERAEKIDVGKNKGSHPVPQEEINRLLLRYAQAGNKVVRLKGGDPFLFGRGAEELESLRRNDVPFRVIPGVSSALAAPAYAGIPVTHRDYASSVHIVTGHGKDGRAPSIPYAQLARLDGTLVFLMALSSAPSIRDGLLEAGMDPGVPAAAIEKGTTPAQRVLVASLGDLAERLAAADFAAPVVIVVGRVAALAERFAWVEQLPLWGRRVLAVSSQTLAGRLAARLRDLGCQVDEFAGIDREVLPLAESFWAGLGQYAWIAFAGAFAVDAFFDRLTEHRIDVRRLAGVKFAAVGALTAKALAGRGVFADFVPETYDARHLAAGLLRKAEPLEKVLLFKAENGTPELAALLRAGGVACDEAAAYRTRINPGDRALRAQVLAGRYDAATFASASSVAAFAALLDGADCPRLEAICIGETTAAAARELGLVVRVSAEATIERMAAETLERLRRIPEESV